MSYTTIPATQIAASQPTSQDLFTLIKNNLDDHESRIANSSGNNGLLPPITFDVLGNVGPDAIKNGLLTYRIPNNVTILACRVFVISAGTSGTLTVDVKYKRGAGAFASILSGTISATSASGSLYVTSGTLSVTSLLTGDLLRLDVSAVQGVQQDFSVIIEVQGA